MNWRFWFRQPAIVKRLQGFLCLSLILNLALIDQVIHRNANKQESSKLVPIPASNQVDLRSFVSQYINSFFSITDEAESFLKEHSEASLFAQAQAELIKRRSLNIQSHITIDDFYLDQESQDEAKAFITGLEEIANSPSRKFRIELLIKPQTLTVIAIPNFRIE